VEASVRAVAAGVGLGALAEAGGVQLPAGSMAPREPASYGVPTAVAAAASRAIAAPGKGAMAGAASAGMSQGMAGVHIDNTTAGARGLMPRGQQGDVAWSQAAKTDMAGQPGESRSKEAPIEIDLDEFKASQVRQST
jgi:hypothetical protein